MHRFPLSSRGSSSWLLPFCLLLTACGGDDAKPSGSEGPGVEDPKGISLTVRGRVQADGSPAEEVTVRAVSDRNGDGKISRDEEITASTDEEGRYSLVVSASKSRSTVVSFRSSGYATVFHTVRARSTSTVELDVALLDVDPLECNGGRCRSSNGSLEITGLDASLSGAGRAFNPVTERDAFPGDFSDDQGNLLISGSFSFVELEDEEGSLVHELEAPVTLTMRVPRDTWPIIVDLEPGNDRIEVPMYAFSEVSGEWTREGDGYLALADGTVLTEDVLPQLRDGSFEGVVNALAEVNHFSYWNVDWPVESHGCVSASLRTAAGLPATGASVRIDGITYTGNSDEVANEEGGFCAAVMRSEDEDEDIDNDGSKGTTHRVNVLVKHDGKLYALGDHEVPSAPGTCGGGCLDLGDVDLTDDKEVVPTICEVEGIVVDTRGVPVADASVVASDALLDYETFEEMCGAGDCDFFVSSDADGRFTFRTPMLAKLDVTAMTTVSDGPLTQLRLGKVAKDLCPTSAVTVELNDGYDMLEIDVTVSGNSIRWTEDEPVNHIFVYSADGLPKWVIGAESATLRSPATFATLPSGFDQYFPVSGSPEPLAAGDVIYVQSDRISEDGILLLAFGQVTLE